MTIQPQRGAVLSAVEDEGTQLAASGALNFIGAGVTAVWNPVTGFYDITIPGSAGGPPAPHAPTHEPGGSDPMTVDAAAAVGSLRTLGITATSACAGNDPRLAGGADVSTTAGTGGVLIGQVVAFVNDGGAARVLPADADGVNTIKDGMGVAVATAAVGVAVLVRVSGEIPAPDARFDALPAVTNVGQRLYLSQTAGRWTLTAPTAAPAKALRTGWVSFAGGAADTTRVVVDIGEGYLNG